MGRTEFGDVRRVDDDLAPVGNHRLEFVHALGGSPHIPVHFWYDRQYPPEGAINVADMHLRREMGSILPGFFRRSAEDAAEPSILRRHDNRDAPFRGRYERSCAVDQATYRRCARHANNGVTGDQRAEPVRYVDYLTTADAGEQIFTLIASSCSYR